MFIPDPDLDFLPIPHPGSRIQDPEINPKSRSATLYGTLLLVISPGYLLTYTSVEVKYWEKG
jgi:hypothetical protein